MQDKIVNQVVSKYQQRSEIGIGKYNTTLQNNNADNFFKHAQEEALDFSLYLEKIMQISLCVTYDVIAKLYVT